MQTMSTVVDKADIDELAYVLATLTTASATQYLVTEAQQKQDFAAAQQKQSDEYAAAQAQRAKEVDAIRTQHAKESADWQTGKRYTSIAGLVCIAVAILVFLLDANDYTRFWGNIVPWTCGLPGLLLLMAGLLIRGKKEPTLPPPLNPPPPLIAPPPPSRSPLPTLAKAYWQLTAIPFGQDRCLLVDTQLEQPMTIVVPTTNASALTQVTQRSEALNEVTALRTLQQLHEALAVAAKQYQLPLFASASEAGVALHTVLHQTKTGLAQHELDAPILPPLFPAEAEYLQHAMSDLVAFAEQPFGLSHEGAQTLLQAAVDWVEQTTARTVGEFPASPPMESLGNAPESQPVRDIFERVLQGLQADVENQIRQLEQEAARQLADAERTHTHDQNELKNAHKTFLQQNLERVAGAEKEHQDINQKYAEVARRLEQAQAELLQNSSQAQAAQERFAIQQANYSQLKQQAELAMADLRTHQTSLEVQRSQVPMIHQSLGFANGELVARQQDFTARRSDLLQNEAAVVQANERLAAAQQELNNVRGLSPSAGVPVQAIADGVKRSEQKLADALAIKTQADQHLASVRAEFQTIQSQIEQIEREIAGFNEQLNALAALEAQMWQLRTNVDTLAAQVTTAEQLLQVSKAEVEQQQRELAQVQTRGKVQSLTERVERYQQELATVEQQLKQLSVAKQEKQAAVDGQRQQLVADHTTTRQRLEIWRNDMARQATIHIDELRVKRDSLIQQMQESQFTLSPGTLDQHLIAYRRAAFEDKQQQLLTLLHDLAGLLNTAQQQVAAHHWAISPQFTTPTDYYLPVWFTKATATSAWQPVAVGKTFLAHPVVEGQLVNAKHSDPAGLLIHHLLQADITTRQANFLEEYQVLHKASQLLPALRQLEQQQWITTDMRTYLEQTMAAQQGKLA